MCPPYPRLQSSVFSLRYHCFTIIIIINIVHEVQNKYKHKRKAKRKAKKYRKAKNMTVATSLYAQMFYGRTNVIFTNSTVR